MSVVVTCRGPRKGLETARTRAALAGLLAAVGLTAGCASMVSRSAGRIADNLTTAILDQRDPETVRQGAPAYLLLIDGLIAGDPDNEELLRAGATLYGAYASTFAGDGERARLLATRARDLGLAALCRAARATCGLETLPYEAFERTVDRLGAADVPALYAAAAAWATWVQVHADDFKAVAKKARVDAMMRRVVALDEGYDRGGAHLYLGVLATLLPPALGGRPDEGRQHFERAIALSGGRNLMAKTLLARHYARMVSDRELHDRLCREVLAADPVEPGLTLINTLARREAERLLAEADEVFGE